MLDVFRKTIEAAVYCPPLVGFFFLMGEELCGSVDFGVEPAVCLTTAWRDGSKFPLPSFPFPTKSFAVCHGNCEGYWTRPGINPRGSLIFAVCPIIFPRPALPGRGPFGESANQRLSALLWAFATYRVFSHRRESRLVPLDPRSRQTRSFGEGGRQFARFPDLLPEVSITEKRCRQSEFCGTKRPSSNRHL